MSRYRSFLPHSTPDAEASFEIDTRNTYTESFIHCLKRNPHLCRQQPSPVVIIQDLYRIIASEWVAVNAYLERDLNAIEWRLERGTANISTLDIFLEQIFVMRRRTRKYESLIDNHVHVNLPTHWLDPSEPSSSAADAISSDFQQVRDLIQRNNERIAQTVSLITSLMSVIEGKRATDLNRRLTILAIVATVAVPFNVFAAVFGMQTEYAPGGEKFGVFLWSATGTVGALMVCYLASSVGPKLEERQRRLMGLG
ncbi:hypothetical protein BU26DRAFT_137672 [Trematosphaeria pertusa]|uniref:Cora-domain-containing protein n=1 Tax=Trematosphaeria pertusa TaxID=390896 RepID=A0A6A6IWF8_9PLEO|nr:uncharacterized protein BU26DRAFT_137672 [Trematosphaeria pertusa]KAF2254407.1 hypothetical protein BU26DRAFT_137672 [Trematosphaeria pertusa]